MNRSSFFLIIFSLWFLGACAQTASIRQEAHQLSLEGESYMVNGKYKEAEAAFTRALQLDEKSIRIETQLAKAKFFQKDYDGAMVLIQPLLEKKGVSLDAIQLYGNCLDELGKDYEALETYRRGLLHHPGSGVLYMEMGILEFSRHRDSTALMYWEKGILAQPTFAPNYYFASKACLGIQDYAWAAFYAEAFINLERIGDRVREMSKVVYQAISDARSYDYAGVFHWKFEGKSNPSPLHQLLDAAFTSALPDTAWKPDIPTLSASRRFAAFYLPSKLPGNSASELFAWQQTIAAQGHFEAYNYWLLYDASPDEFFAWYEQNKARYDQFESWFLRNPFQKTLRKPIAR
jgi:tetratricopeptide (TPR) repeat protein